jgi:hypothetical protein
MGPSELHEITVTSVSPFNKAGRILVPPHERAGFVESISYRNEVEEGEPEEPTLKSREWGTQNLLWTLRPSHRPVNVSAIHLFPTTPFWLAW